MITKQAEKMFTKQQVVNNQGQIVNQEKFNEALIALMKEKYTGGMEKQATTIKGMWSTITGVTKSGLSTIVGMGTDGNIRKGSALSYLASGIGALSKKIQELQNNGGLDKISAKFDAFAAKIAAHKDMIINGLQTAWTVIKTVFSGISTVMGWAIQHSDILIPVLAGVVSAFAAFNVLNTAATALKSVASAMQLVKDAGGMLNIAKNLTSPLGIAVLAIGAAVTAGMLLYKNWDKIKAKAVQIGSAIKRMFTDIKNALVNTFNSAKTKLNSVFNWIKKKLENIPFVGKIFGAMNDADVNIGASHHALGTPYFSGGLTHINERGGEIVNLPNGTQIIPHDVSRETINNHNGKSVVVNLTIQGNVIGNREYMERTGEYVANKLLEVL
jgi:phage-related minor tail protein